MTAAEQFPDRPILTAYLPWETKSGLWYFERNFRFGSPHGAAVIPAGFETDFGSIPAFLRGFVDDDDPKALCPFLRHDKRYADGIGDREQWDDELRDGMIVCGSSRLKAALVHRAVRLFGGSHFKPKTL
jgi:hypothetical protein